MKLQTHDKPITHMIKYFQGVFIVSAKNVKALAITPAPNNRLAPLGCILA